MSFFGFWSSTTEPPKTPDQPKGDSDPQSKESTHHSTTHDEVDPAKLSKLGDDKIFSNIDADTGEVKANLYNPPNLLLGMSTEIKSEPKSVFQLDSQKNQTPVSNELQMDEFSKELEAMNEFDSSNSFKFGQKTQYESSKYLSPMT